MPPDGTFNAMIGAFTVANGRIRLLRGMVRDLDDYRRAIACNIRGHCESCGLTQQHLAELAGLARSHISSLEQGSGNEVCHLF